MTMPQRGHLAILNSTRSEGMHLTEGFNETNFEVATAPNRATDIKHFTKDCAVADTGYPLAPSSILINKVWLSAREANTGICRWGGTASAPSDTNGGAIIPKPSQGGPIPIDVRDLVFVQVASTVGSDDVDVSYTIGGVAS